MENAVLEHIVRKIKDAPLHREPYPHFFIEEFFPEEYYQKLLESLPELSYYVTIAETGKVIKGSYKERHILPLHAPEKTHLPNDLALFWQDLSHALKSKSWISEILSKFEEAMKERFGILYDILDLSPVIELIKDQSNYSIGPHTDLPHRICTLLFYFPKGREQRNLGTSIYVPKNPTFGCEGRYHHRFEDFNKVKTLPFLPNSLFGFFKSDSSFHGVEPIKEKNVERNLLNYYLKWNSKWISPENR